MDYISMLLPFFCGGFLGLWIGERFAKSRDEGLIYSKEDVQQFREAGKRNSEKFAKAQASIQAAAEQRIKDARDEAEKLIKQLKESWQSERDTVAEVAQQYRNEVAEMKALWMASMSKPHAERATRPDEESALEESDRAAMVREATGEGEEFSTTYQEQLEMLKKEGATREQAIAFLNGDMDALPEITEGGRLDRLVAENYAVETKIP